MSLIEGKGRGLPPRRLQTGHDRPTRPVDFVGHPVQPITRTENLPVGVEVPRRDEPMPAVDVSLQPLPIETMAGPVYRATVLDSSPVLSSRGVVPCF